MLTDPVFLLIFLPALLFSLTFHEAAHAWMAWRLGDPTARMLGRLTLNPIAHLDFFGTLMLIISQFRFGWAKPVPVDPRNFHNEKQGIFLTAAAGPASNILLAIACGIGIRLLLANGWGSSMVEGFWPSLGRIIGMALIMNLSLAFFNLIPLPPLDGSKILYGLSPREWDRHLWHLEQVGPMILIGIIAIGMFAGFSPIWIVIGPVVNFFCHAMSGLPIGYLYALIYTT
jgi:Zn-dependent protease